MAGALGLVHCVDGPTTPGGARSTFAFEPRWDSRATQTAALLDDAGLPLDRVRIILVKPPSDTVKDTTLVMHSGDAAVDLPLNVDARPGEQLELRLQFLSGATILFEGSAQITTVPLTVPSAPATPVTVAYVGPGATAASVDVSPGSGSFPTSSAVTFTATARDANGVVLPNTPFVWSVNDATLGAISGAGVLTPTGKRGNVIVTAATLSQISGTATVGLLPAPATISVVSGDNQSGPQNTTLASPVVVVVKAADGIASPGETVTFAALDGGAVTTAYVVTDANGLAQTTLKIGTRVGAYGFTATTGSLSVPITATGTASGTAAVTIISGDAQVDTVAKSLSPFVVKVTAANGDPMSGATVTWTRLTGSGSPATTTSLTNASGLASLTYTLGTTPGGETVRASVVDVTTTPVFTATAVAGAPATVVIISGNAQVDTIHKTLANPFVVKVSDAHGNAVSSASVSWARIGGFGSPANTTSTTNALGLASLTYTLGDIGGADTVRASVVGVSGTVSFIVAVRDGLGTPIVTGFAYLQVLPSPITVRVGDTLTLTADSVSATGQASPVTASWASDNPGRGVINATGRMIVADTGQIIVTATRNGMIGHARVTVLPAPMLTGFTFSPKALNGIANSPLTFSLSFSVTDKGASGVTSAVVTITGPTGVTRTCTATAPTSGNARNGTFDCAITLPAGSATGAWHVTSLVLTGSISRTFLESVLATFGTTTLTVNP